MISSVYQSGLASDAKDLAQLKNGAKQNTPGALRETAKQFEALFLNQVLKSMRDASVGTGMFDNEQSKMFGGMLDQQISQSMAAKGVGLSDVLVRQLSAMQGQTLEQVGAPQGVEANNPAQGNLLFHEKKPKISHFESEMTPHAERAGATIGVEPKFLVAQAGLESGWGQKIIHGSDGKNSFNLFGIKADSKWKGPSVDVVTTEFKEGVAQKRIEKFRVYESYAHAFEDYASLLRGNERYSKVVGQGADVEGFTRELQRSGYASDPKYSEKLSSIIKANFLS